MHTMTAGELKTRFSDAPEMAREGEDIVITFDNGKEKVSVLTAYERLYKKAARKAVLLACKARFAIRDDFRISDSELLSS